MTAPESVWNDDAAHHPSARSLEGGKPALGLAALTGASALVLRRAHHEDRPSHPLEQATEKAADRVTAEAKRARQAAAGLAETVKDAAKQRAEQKAVQKAALKATQKTLKGLEKKELQMLERSRKAAGDAVREARAELKHVPRRAEVSAFVKAELNRQLGEHLEDHHEELEHRLHQHFVEQNEALGELNKHLKYLNRHVRRRGGGFPWGLLLLGGAGYYVWRTPALRDKVLDAAEQVRPGITAKLRGAGPGRGEQAAPPAQGSAADTQIVARIDPQLQVDARWPQDTSKS